VLAPDIRHDAPANYYAERKAQAFKLGDDSKDVYQGGLAGAGAYAGVREAGANAGMSADDMRAAEAGAGAGGAAETQNGFVAKSLPGQTLAGAGAGGREAAAAVAPSASAVMARPGAFFQQSLEFSAEGTEKNQAHEFPGLERKTMEPIVALAQLDNSYILCRQGNSLVIIDQHAAHERIRFTEIFSEFEQKKIITQPLMTPLQFELSQKEAAIFEEHKDVLAQLGFEVEPFGGRTFSLHAVPSHLAEKDLQLAFTGLLDEFIDGKNGKFEEQSRRALTYIACRSAVKFGDPLGREEQAALVEKLQTLDQPYTCPHGRPTMITMSADELKKRFGREYSAM
jgi:DNA mismatch repair ATPase MutL